MTISKSGPPRARRSGIEEIEVEIENEEDHERAKLLEEGKARFKTGYKHTLNTHRDLGGLALGHECKLCGYGVCLRCGWCEHCNCALDALEDWVTQRSPGITRIRHPWKTLDR